jgi:predicted transcriptional regulator
MPSEFDKTLQEMLKDSEFRKHYMKEKVKLEVALQLSELRKKRNLTQSQLARKVKSTQSVIARIENGNQNLSLKTIETLVTALKGEIHVAITG